MLRMLGVVVAVALMPVVARAQALVEQVPADAMVYIGWAGARELAEKYEGTHLQGLVEASQLKGVMEQTWPALKAMLTEKHPEAAEVLADIDQAMRVGWKHPMAIYLRPLEANGLRGAVLIDGGEDADAMAGLIDQIIAGAPQEMRAAAVRRGPLVGWGFGHLEGEPIIVENLPRHLGTDEKFTTALRQVQPSPAAMLYVNVKALGSMGDQHSDEMRQRLQILSNLLEGIETIAWTGGFEGKGWATQMFVAAPAPRVGMARVLESEPVSEALLKAIPQSADWVAVRRLDLGKVYNEIRAALEKTDPDLARMMDMGAGGVTMALGGNVQETLLEPLGDEWAVYTAPPVTGTGLLSGVVLNRVDDAAKLNRGLSNLALLVTNTISGQLRGPNRQPVMRLLVQHHMHNGTRISYINSPFITPAWAIKDDILYMGLYPQTVAGAMEAAGSGSILDKPAFQAVRKQLPEVAATSISFVDLPETAQQSYTSLLMAAQLYMGAADLVGAEGQPLLLPPLAQIMPHLTPSGRVAWVDEAGWHARTIGPFPMHDLFAGEASAAARQFGPIMAIVVPALERGRRQAAGRAVEIGEQMQMWELWLAILLYANEHGQQFPPNLGALLPYVDDASVFVHVGEVGMIPPDLEANPAALAAWINANSPYVYIRPAGKLTEVKNAGRVIVIHETLEGRGDDEEVNVLFVDGHVDRITVARVRKMLSATNEGP